MLDTNGEESFSIHSVTLNLFVLCTPSAVDAVGCAPIVESLVGSSS